MSSPSTQMSGVHGSGMTRYDQAASVAVPTVPTSSPATAPNSSGRRSSGRQGDQLDEDRRAEVERQRRGRLAEHRPDDQAMTPRRTRKKTAAPTAPPGPPTSRAATSARPAAPAIIIGCRTRRNCGTPKSNSAWKTDRPMSMPPSAKTRSEPGDDRRAAWPTRRGGAAPPARARACR